MSVSSHINRVIYIVFLYGLINFVSTNGKTKHPVVQMRVVKETANYGYFGSNMDVDNHLMASVEPANFSGPILLKRLFGKCFNLTQERYRYVLCPFKNISQYEISPRWNAYQGILGVWSHWNISNNTFVSMVYANGDHCGDIDRIVNVVLECGSTHALVNVTEPSRCQYTATFHTKYVCHRDAMLVYPRLKPELRKKWDEIYTDYHYGYLTEKGYNESLAEIFRLAGLTKVVTSKPTISTTPAIDLSVDTVFTDLLSCNKEYKNLQREVSQLHQEIEALKILLDLHDVKNRTQKPHR